jgi:glycerate-2-kinase
MVPDSTLFSDAIEVLKRYGLWIKAGGPIRKALEQGAGGILEETPKREDPIWRHVSHVLIGNGELAVKAAAGQLRLIGYRPKIVTSSLVGEAKEVAKVWAALAKEEQRKKRSDRPLCLLAGGETTVTVRGAGRGGRCQEFALSAAISISGVDGMTVAAFSTDGADGPTDAAGAIADGKTLRRAEQRGLDARRFLNENNSHAFFESLGGLLRTGPTRNHLNDLYFAFIH